MISYHLISCGADYFFLRNLFVVWAISWAINVVTIKASSDNLWITNSILYGV